MKRYPQILLTILAAGIGSAVVVAGLFIGAYYYLEPSIPSAAELRDLEIQEPLQIYTRDGRLMQEFGERKRTPVDYDEFPPLLIKAVLAAEDEHFFEHPGIDYRGIIRGAISELFGRRNVGGSTITQQLPRTLEVTSRAGLSSGLDRFVNKYREWILAIRIEREFTKEEILELFLNTSLMGGRSYGMATAAQTYFGKSLSELTVSETAILAGILQRPNDWNPIASPKNAATRRSYVLGRMKETGAIDEQQYAIAMAEPVQSGNFGSPAQIAAPYVGEMVRAEMVERFGEHALTAGLKVTTSIDSRHQAAANRAIRDTLMTYDERHGYRGPLTRVDLPGAGANAGPAAAGEAVAYDPAALRALLEDAPPSLLDYETAIVLAAGELDGQVFFAEHGVQAIGLDAVEWAARFVTDDIWGEKPKTVAEVLRPGDVVRFRRTREGGWRLAQIPEVQGAFVAVDPLDGAIVALTGGFDFFLSNYNRATQARRQPGSAFKPFLYSAAFENGSTPATVVTDAPLDLGYQAALERVWRPENFGGKYFGPTRLREALLESMNSVSVRMLQTMGVPAAVEHVKRFGFDDTAVPKDLALALGSGGVAPLDLATGYAAFANGGYRVEHYFIDRVTTADGELVYAARPAICAECNTPPETPPRVEPETEELVADATELYPQQHAAERVISARNAFLITDLLRDNVVRGTGAGARRALGRNDLAGKTGTTNEGRDTWFVGFNPNVVGAAWVGFDDQSRPLGAREQGSYTALPMWTGFMSEALAGAVERPLVRPPGIVEYRIDPATGLIANDCRPDSIFEKFDIEHLPEREPADRVCSGSFNALEPGSDTRPSGEPIF
ncbi:MAG TPA: PBP1A family penicillin-binding protein [Gammaproteobacteria bacterium]|nr:PBP1A family penicillin-binding protein [Gammaproteobacteria bacterium]